MCAFRLGPWTVALLVAAAACGRIGYEGVAPVARGDGPMPARDAADPGMDAVAEVDQGPLGPDLGPDVPADLTRADPPPDATTLPDGPARVETLPRDQSVDTPSARTVVATGQNATPRRGASGGGAGTVDLCPDGGLLLGFEGTHSTNPSSPVIQSVTGVCATITLAPAGAPPTTWELTRLPARGNVAGTRWSRLCPAGQVLVGFDGNAGQGSIGQLVFRCAPITLDASGRAVVLGSRTELDDIGSGASNDFPETDCPPGQAARGADTVTSNVLESFALICATLVVR